MTTKQTPPTTPHVWIEDPGTGCLFARYPWKKYRILFDDGSTMDIVAIRDDSDLRAAALAWSKTSKIAGVALLTPVPEPSGNELMIAPPKPKTRRQIARS